MAPQPETSPVIDRETVRALLGARVAELKARGIRGIALFGSVARREAHAGSDVDLLVDLDPAASLGLGVVSLKAELQQLLGHPVGLTFASRLRPGIRERIERDLVPIF